MSNSTLLQPVLQKDRILSLDVIRGIAVLGILIMNIQSMSMPGAAYINPEAYGDLTGINKWVWILSHVLADSKFITIFSILFGASVILLTDKSLQAGKKPAGLHYRRNFWLLIFGLIHAYFIWYGDILTVYAVCSFLLFLFRKISVKGLIIWGLVFLSLGSLIYLMTGFSMPAWPEEAREGMLQAWRPDAGYLDHEIRQYTGNWRERMAVRVEDSLGMHTMVFLTLYFWRVMGSMLLGMALFKSGFLSGRLSTRFYIRMMIVGLLAGGALVVFGVFRNFAEGWQVEYSMFIGSQFNYWGSILMALAYMSIIILMVNQGLMKGCLKRMAMVGRMALSNYLLMSVIAVLLFYGAGAGLLGQVERKIQILIVFGIWLLLIVFSTLWLKRFRFGPFEWLWRSLTYWKIQEMKK